MKCDDKMFSVGEIIKSKEFEREAPENFPFAIRRAERDKRRRDREQVQKVNQNKNIRSAK